MSHTDLTLIVTAYRDNYLAEALLSVAAQTYHRFDLICCADVNYSDDALQCFENFFTHIPCFSKKLLTVQGNGTAGYVRNVGFRAAKTTWVAYLDGDDFLHPTAIERVHETIERDQGKIPYYSTAIVRVTIEGKQKPIPASLDYYPPRWIYSIDPDIVGHRTYFNQFNVIRKSEWEAYPFDETTNGEDIDYTLHHLLRGQFMKIPEYLYFFRDTPESFSKFSFPSGDICTQRYRDGYYKRLFERMYTNIVADNFRDTPIPSIQ
ncbi:Glycosyl transferase, family 2 [Beggiatoa sp. PS]|nr:Glycosyl transferase, family 2 [Beggiatoa sp. PS]